MSSRKFKTYCRIIDYVDAADPELSELLRGTCTDMTLGSLRGKPGITFLMPQDKAVRKKIADLAYSSKIEEANKAIDMLNAHIIRDVFKSPSDWLAKKDDIPNSLLPSQHVEIESASGKEVVFKSGAKAVLDTDFLDSSRRSNLAVWKLVSGEIPVTTDKPAKLKYARRPQQGKGKIGSYEVASMASQSERFKIAIAVENAYVLQELSRRTDKSVVRDDVFVKHALSLIHYILHVRNDTGLMYDKVLPLISLDKLDFYLLIEPHRNTTQHLLDDMLVHEWWLNKNMNFSCADLMREIEGLLASGQGAMVYTNRQALLEKIADCRQKLIPKIDARPRDCVGEIESVYKELESNNSIGGLGPVYPAPLAHFYSSEPRLKLIHDELRYLTFGAFRKLEASPDFDIGEFSRLVNMIGDYLHAATEDERCKVSMLCSRNVQWQIAPLEKVQEIKIFVNSTMFMYIPLTRSEADGIKQKYSVTRPDPRSIMLFNISKNIYAGHRRLLSDQSGQVNGDVANVLQSLDVDKLDPALREMLKRKLGM